MMLMVEKLNLSEMTEKELKELSRKTDARLKEIKKEREAKELRKKNYALATPEPEFHTDYEKAWKTICDRVNSGGGKLTENDLKMIWRDSSYQLPIKKEEVYPCPECGKMSLYAGEYGDYDRIYGTGKSKQKITCSCCDFVCPAKASETEYDAWDMFHRWLVKKGYLEK